MPPPATGTIRHNLTRHCYQTRVRFKDGRRLWVDLPRGLSREQALTRSKSVAKEAKLRNAPKRSPKALAHVHAGETVTDYFERFCAERTRRGILTVYDDRCRFVAHVQPVIGHLSIANTSKDEVEALRDALDSKVLAGSYESPSGRVRSFGWKSASNVWTLVTTIFAAACSSKRRDLRMREDDPTHGIQPPDRGKKKGKQFLYPSEIMTLLSCPVIPLHWRRGYALATYLYLRAGELEALTWGDVDIDHRSVSINKATQSDGTIGPPKNGEPRRVPIEDTLVPLLSVMLREATEAAREKHKTKHAVDSAVRAASVVPMPQRNNRADILRADLKRAGVGRSELFAKDATRTPLTYHDLRATGLTWRAIRGDSLMEIKVDAGHKNVSTTEIYLRVATAVRRGFGDVFPLTPASLSQGRSVTRPVTSGV